MANDLNQCNFIGRLGADPEIRYRPEGGAVGNFSIACNWKSKDKEGSEWVRIVVYDRLAEICGEYIRKGSKVFVSGRLRTRKWQDNQGVERYTTEIIANDLQMLDGVSNNGVPQPQAGQNRQAPARPAPQQTGYGQRPAAPTQNNMGGAPMAPPIDFDDDLPF